MKKLILVAMLAAATSALAENKAPVKVVFGLGMLREAGEEAAKLGRRALVVSYADASVKGTLAKLKGLLDAAGVASQEFLEVVPNPPFQTACGAIDAISHVAGVGAGVWSDFSILDSISRADAEAAPDAEAAADYARRYARWRLFADKLGEWSDR